ncbi:guanine nucleotide exchange factor [Amylostereum chailletii]|nr:guanine nucleotide exchange factor [Amylostereum chailletii]
MATTLNAYSSLSPKASKADVAKALQAIVDAPSFGLDDASRVKLVGLLLVDLKLVKEGKSGGRLSTNDVALALSALKSLGKHPSGARVLSSSDNLSFLLALADAFKDNFDASCEALRCVANTLLLVEAARRTLIEEGINGGETAVVMLEKSSSPDLIFLASRILFLSTASSASAGDFIVKIIEQKPSSRTMAVVDIISLRLDSLVISLLGGAKMAREAMTDLLKFTYNIVAHYPKIVDCEKVTDLGAGDGKVLSEYWSDRLDNLLPAVLRAFNALPPSAQSPLAPPLSHLVHALIAIPITSTLRPVWFPSASASPSPASREPRSSTSSRASPTQAPGEPSSSRESRPHGAFDRAMSMLSAGRRSLSSRPSSPNPSSTSSSSSSTPPSDTVQRAWDLLEAAFAHYFPGTVESDDASVRARAKDESDSTIDELLCPLVILLTKLAIADPPTRTRVREWVVPPTLDRSSALEGRADTLGRLLRVLTSVYHPRLKVVSGEFLFALCNSDSTQLIAQVGYGNVAGFLFNKGIVTGPPSGDSGEGPSSGAHINPITGAIQEPAPDLEMTEEERELEAEKLFVLFDRLERTGAIPPSSNPVRKAIAEGRFG